MKRNKENKKKVRKPGEPIVIEFNLSKSVVITIVIIVLIATITTAKVVTTIIQGEESKTLANVEETSNERVTYVNSTTKDKGFVIYEGDVDRSTILVGDGENTTTATNTESIDITENEETKPAVEENIATADTVIEENVTAETTTAEEKDDSDNIKNSDKNNNENEKSKNEQNDKIAEESSDIENETPTQQDINIFNLQKSRNQYDLNYPVLHRDGYWVSVIGCRAILYIK